MNEDLDRFAATTIAKGSNSFARAARLFDAETRRDVRLLYAWCRHCDDVIDGQVLGHGHLPATKAERQERLAALKEASRQALQGRHDEPAFAALGHVASRHGIDLRHVDDLLAGFAMDVEEQRYETPEELLTYCYHVAGVVGVMMARMMGVRDEITLHRACDLGMAFQLTNISRDVIEDAAARRVYLPLSWLKEEGIPPEKIAESVYRPSLHRLTLRLLEMAEPYYASARIGLESLPYRSAWAIASALSIYRDIGVRLREGDHSVWDSRISTGKWRKTHRIVEGAIIAAVAQRRKQLDLPRNGLWTRAA